MTYIIRFEDKEKEFLMGGKAKAIAQLQRAGFLIPKGFVLSPAAFEDSVNTQQKLTSLHCKNIKQFKRVC
jgi:rifampicin phosphotransferase